MKYASIKVLVLVLSTGGLIAACASGSDSVDFSSGSGGGATSTSAASGGGNGGNGGGFGGGDAVTTSGTTAGSTGSSNPNDAGNSCIPKCNADSDCQNSCPATQTGSNCCDTDTGLCYVASTQTCPAPPTDGGTVTPPY